EKVSSVRRPCTTAFFLREVSHGSPHRRESSLLSGRCPRSAQPPRPTPSPDGHPGIDLLCYYVRRQELRRDLPRGSRPRHRPDAPTRLHTQTAQTRRHPQSLDRPEPERL